MKKITAYCLEWHVKNSDAFRDMLVEPLSTYTNIELTGWDGEHLSKKTDPDSPLIFCMLPPPETLYKSKQPMVWLPMWDQAQGYDQAWWNKLPKSLRVVAFSDVIYQKATAAGLPTLRLTYFKNPSDFKRVSWDDGLILFYWNRTGMIGPRFIEQLCSAIKPKELLFMAANDPGIEENKHYTFPAMIGNTKVTNVELSDRDTFLKKTNKANIIIAPRLTEGVGMTFLEAMCRGGVVLGNNAPTMSEYIQDGSNGLLFDNTYHSLSERAAARARRQPIQDNVPSPYLLSDIQNWKKVSKTNFRNLGNRAYEQHVAGYAEWQKSIKEYADFVLNW